VIVRVYFVRHAQSEKNAKGQMHMYEAGGLSENGQEQAEKLAGRFAEEAIYPEVILTSPYERARATAETLSREVQAPVENCELLVEFRGVSKLEGKPKDDPEVVRIDAILTAGRNGDPYFRFADEETFDELTQRARDLVDHLVQRPEERIICVSHGVFLRVILGVMMYREVGRQALNGFMAFVSITNTGITVCDFCEEKQSWKLVTLNDLAHIN
jgi:broad specificity phosphatase PhoE